MGQVLFIVWRESVEAMLVVGILHAWMSQHGQQDGKRWLWGGVGAGLLLAGVLALGLFVASAFFGTYQDVFQAGMVFAAAALIVHMVLWMREHGRTLKRELESGLATQAERNNGWGILLLVALAVAREGSETVVFLYGTFSGSEGQTLPGLTLAGAAGFALALLTFWLLQLGRRHLSWALFFRITEIMLLLLAAALFTSGIDKLISMDILPALLDPVWNSSALLDDMTATGGVVSALTGYRAQPALMTLLAYGAYWLGVSGLILWRKRAARARLAAC